MELLVGLVGALVGIGLFLVGFFLGKKQGNTWAPVDRDLTPEEIVKIQEEREELKKEQNAFRELMNYNAETAYNINNSNK